VILSVISVAIVAIGYGCLQAWVIPIVEGPFWFLFKVFCILFFYVWVRGTLPRFRYDQLMNFGWKLLLPVAIANLVVTAFVVMVLNR
jgi:NADH-quinone oxidoreductase subunit H